MGVDLSRLRHSRLQRGFALRSVYLAAARRRPAAAGQGPPAADGDGLSDARRPLHEQSARHHRRSHRRGDARPARSDRDLRSLSRSQVRSHSSDGLLLAVRRLRQFDRTAGTAAVRGAAEDAGLRVVPQGVGEARARPGRVRADEGATSCARGRGRERRSICWPRTPCAISRAPTTSCSSPTATTSTRP